MHNSKTFPGGNHYPGNAMCAPRRSRELVFTTWTKEAFPLIRYRTRIFLVSIPAHCRCWSNPVRMDRLKGVAMI
jgi:phenylacetate-coenzyme A ligase PaaK-like adenylate-forming protein